MFRSQLDHPSCTAAFEGAMAHWVSDELRGLKDAGIHIGTNGRVRGSFAELPLDAARRYTPPMNFVVDSFSAAARQSGVPRDELTRDLKALNPRSTDDEIAVLIDDFEMGGASRRAARYHRTDVYYDQIFPNLRVGGTASQRLVRAGSPVLMWPRHVGTGYLQITQCLVSQDDGVISTVLNKLDLPDEDDLERLMQQPWFLVALNELDQDSPEGLGQASLLHQEYGSLLGLAGQEDTLRRAVRALRSGSWRHVGEQVDKDGWTAQDHHIRFVVRTVLDATQPGMCWESRSPWDADRLDGARTRRLLNRLCARALWLLGWVHFLQAPSAVAKAVTISTTWGPWLESVRESFVQPDPSGTPWDILLRPCDTEPDRPNTSTEEGVPVTDGGGMPSTTGFRVRCTFCIGSATYTDLDTVLAHIRDDHLEKLTDDRLRLISEVVDQYRRHCAGCASQIEIRPSLALKINEVAQPQFNWQVVRAWQF